MRVEGHPQLENTETPFFIIEVQGTPSFFLSINAVMVFIRANYPELETNNKLRYGKKKIGWSVELPTKDGDIQIRCVAAYKASGRSDRGRPRKTQEQTQK